MACGMDIKPILTCYVNDCKYVSNAVAHFCVNLGTMTISHLNISNSMYYF